MKIYSVNPDYSIHKYPSFRNISKASQKVLKPVTSRAIETSLAGLSVLGASTLIANPRLVKLEESKMVGEYEMLETLNGENRSFATVDIDKKILNLSIVLNLHNDNLNDHIMFSFL